MLWVRISIRARCTTLCEKVYQCLATGRWFSPDPPVSSNNKTDRHAITEILLKVALNTIKPNLNHVLIIKAKVLPLWHRWPKTISAILFGSFCFLVPKEFLSVHQSDIKSFYLFKVFVSVKVWLNVLNAILNNISVISCQ